MDDSICREASSVIRCSIDRVESALYPPELSLADNGLTSSAAAADTVVHDALSAMNSIPRPAVGEMSSADRRAVDAFDAVRDARYHALDDEAAPLLMRWLQDPSQAEAP